MALVKPMILPRRDASEKGIVPNEPSKNEKVERDEGYRRNAFNQFKSDRLSLVMAME